MPMTELNTSARWDSAADNYQQVFRLGINEYNTQALRLFTDRGMIFPGARVLDIGCGVGKYGTYLSALGCSVTLSDISPRMLEHAKKNLAPWPGTEFVCGDFAGDIFTGEAYEKSFDLVMSTMSPAISTADTIAKACRLSRGWVYLTNFVTWRQPLRDALMRTLGIEPKGMFDRSHLAAEHDSLIALLDDAGIGYELDFVPYHWADDRSPEEMTDYMIKNYELGSLFSGLDRDAVLRAAKSLADENGSLSDAVETTVARILWKVR